MRIMKRTLSIAAAAAAALLLALPALAQEASPTAGFLNAQTADQYLAKDNLIGAKVHGADGTIVGDIEDLIISDYHQVVGVVMGTGGVLGFAEKRVGVELSALKFEDKDGKTTITLPGATADALAALPEYTRTKPAKSLLERAQEKAQELSDKTTKTTKDAYEKSKPALEQAKEKAAETYEKVKEATEPALEATKEAIGSAVEKAKDALDQTGTGSEPPPEAPSPETAPPVVPSPDEPAPVAPPQE
jgi:hypothetical protein